MLEVKEGNNVFQLDCPSFKDLQHAYVSFLKEKERNRIKSNRQYARKKEAKKAEAEKQK